MSYPVDLDSRGKRRGEVKCSSTCYLIVRCICLYGQVGCDLALRHESPDLLLGWLIGWLLVVATEFRPHGRHDLAGELA